MAQTLRKMGVGVAALGVVVACVSGLTVLAAPPGPIDGQNIPANFGAENLVATQLNVTGYGDQTVTFGGLTNGSELNQLFLAKTGSELKLAISGNWNTTNDDNHVLIFIGGTGGGTLGQTEIRAEGVDGPPFRLQDLSRVYNLNTNGTPGDTVDDTCDFVTNGVTLPCPADYALGIDTFGGNLSVSLYTLFSTPIATAECGPQTSFDVFATRQFVAQTALSNTNGIATNPQGLGFDSLGMNNDNIDGVTDTDASGAATANTGLEMTIPFAALGLTGNETITLDVILTGGGSGGFVSNQAFPATGPACETPGVRPNLASRSCLSVSLAALPTWTGGAEDSDGQITPAHYGGTAAATQSCPTDFGDQRPDPNAVVVSGGSELNQLFVTNDSQNVYVGITGNLERNGNGLMLFFETGQPGGSGGTTPLAFPAGQGRMSGMASNNGQGGSFLPFNLGANGVIDLGPSGDDEPIDFDYAFEVNGSGDNIWVDHKDLINQVHTYYGKNLVNSNGTFTSEGVTGTIDFQFAYSFFNDAGVPGSEADLLTQAEVAAAAATATFGFEFQIPLASIGLTSDDLPRDIEIWALVTGGDGVWISNQALPSLRDPTGTQSPADNYGNLDQGPHDYSADGPAAVNDPFNEQKSSYARSARVTLVAGGPACAAADVNCDGSVNAGDLLSIRAPGTWQSTGDPGFVRSDVNNDGAVNAGDLLSVRAPGTWQTSTGPCECP